MPSARYPYTLRALDYGFQDSSGRTMRAASGFESYMMTLSLLAAICLIQPET